MSIRRLTDLYEKTELKSTGNCAAICQLTKKAYKMSEAAE